MVNWRGTPSPPRAPAPAPAPAPPKSGGTGQIAPSPPSSGGGQYGPGSHWEGQTYSGGTFSPTGSGGTGTPAPTSSGGGGVVVQTPTSIYAVSTKAQLVAYQKAQPERQAIAYMLASGNYASSRFPTKGLKQTGRELLQQKTRNLYQISTIPKKGEFDTSTYDPLSGSVQYKSSYFSTKLQERIKEQQVKIGRITRTEMAEASQLRHPPTKEKTGRELFQEKTRSLFQTSTIPKRGEFDTSTYDPLSGSVTKSSLFTTKLQERMINIQGELSTLKRSELVKESQERQKLTAENFWTNKVYTNWQKLKWFASPKYQAEYGRVDNRQKVPWYEFFGPEQEKRGREGFSDLMTIWGGGVSKAYNYPFEKYNIDRYAQEKLGSGKMWAYTGLKNFGELMAQYPPWFGIGAVRFGAEVLGSGGRNIPEIATGVYKGVMNPETRYSTLLTTALTLGVGMRGKGGEMAPKWYADKLRLLETKLGVKPGTFVSSDGFIVEGYTPENIPKKYRTEYADYKRIADALKSGKIEMKKDIDLSRVEGIKDYPKVQKILHKLLAEGEVVIGGSLAMEGIKGVKILRSPRDFDVYGPIAKLKQIKQAWFNELKKSGEKVYLTEKGIAVNTRDNVVVTFHGVEKGTPSLLPSLRSVAGRGASLSDVTTKLSSGILVPKPEFLLQRKYLGGFEKGKGGKPLDRYSKDIPAYLQASQIVLKQQLKGAQSLPWGFKQYRQFKAGRGLEYLKPYKEALKKERVEPGVMSPGTASMRPNYFTAGLKYVEWELPSIGKKGVLYGGKPSSDVRKPYYNVATEKPFRMSSLYPPILLKKPVEDYSSTAYESSYYESKPSAPTKYSSFLPKYSKTSPYAPAKVKPYSSDYVPIKSSPYKAGYSSDYTPSYPALKPYTEPYSAKPYTQPYSAKPQEYKAQKTPPYYRPPMLPPYKPPKTPPPEPKLKFGKEEKWGKGFDVFARRRGQWFKITPKAVEKGKAFNIGAKYTKWTAGASFKVLPSTKPVRISKTKPYYWGRVRGQYYSKPSKSGETIYIQKNVFRIMTSGEKKQITYKGILASQRARARSSPIQRWMK